MIIEALPPAIFHFSHRKSVVFHLFKYCGLQADCKESFNRLLIGCSSMQIATAKFQNKESFEMNDMFYIHQHSINKVLLIG